MKVAAAITLLLALVAVGCVFVGTGGSYHKTKVIEGTNKVFDLDLSP